MIQMLEQRVRWGWLVFGSLLASGVVRFMVSSDWSKQSVLNLINIVVSIVAVAGVFLYSFAVQGRGATFWRWFRWCFVTIAGVQVAVRVIEVARQRGYSAAGSIALLVFAALILGPIFYFQWAAMTRLAAKKTDA